MIPQDPIPYTAIGFVVFWMTILVLVPILSKIGLIYLRSGLKNIDDWVWEGKDINGGESPDGWKFVAAYVLSIIIPIVNFRRPLVWRWSEYKDILN